MITEKCYKTAKTNTLRIIEDLPVVIFPPSFQSTTILKLIFFFSGRMGQTIPQTSPQTRKPFHTRKNNGSVFRSGGPALVGYTQDYRLHCSTNTERHTVWPPRALPKDASRQKTVNIFGFGGKKHFGLFAGTRNALASEQTLEFYQGRDERIEGDKILRGWDRTPPICLSPFSQFFLLLLLV